MITSGQSAAVASTHRVSDPIEVDLIAQRCPVCGRKVILPCIACVAERAKRLQLELRNMSSSDLEIK